MIAPETPPDAEPTMTDSAVAMNSALPSPQPARKPTMPAIELEDPASAENATTSPRPSSSVRRGPIRLETQPVISMQTPVTAKYEVKSSETWLGVACRSCAMAGRIGSTRPMPMNATTQANATAQTALG